MDWFLEQEDPLAFAEHLKVPGRPLYRFRIGNYRVVFTIKNGIVSILFVLTVSHRKDAYRQM
jgi:mRNA-degrading endonuclease RelE of RelBE toxin-antitoxin system